MDRTNSNSLRGNPAWAVVSAYPRLLAGSLLLLILIILALGAPLFTSYGPLDQHLDAVLQPPGGPYLLGTDQLGRDLFTRTLYGGRLVLAVAVVSTAIAMTVGVLLGLLSGYRRGWLDTVLMRSMDGVIVFPELILALGITYALGPSFWTVTAAIATVNVPKFARVMRGQLLSLREREFVAAAKVSGVPTMRILALHLLPNVLEVTVVQAALTGGLAIFTAASLSFLGLGLPAPAPDWGGILRDGYPYLGYVPLLSLVPGLVIFAAMLSFNLIGDGLRDLFDPKVLPRTAARGARAFRRASGRLTQAPPAVVAEPPRPPSPAIVVETSKDTLMTTEPTAPLLDVRGLEAVYDSPRGEVHALNGVSFSVKAGEVLALVGESGSGKSASALAIMGLLHRTRGRVTAGHVLFRDHDLLTLSERELRSLRGNEIALVFQNPMTTLNPTLTIGAQLVEVIRHHTGTSRREAGARALELLRLVEIPDPKARLKSYPHQLSGGLRQRVMIALALSCDPALLITDEATTALDVTTQAQVLHLLKRISAELGTALVVITHNMGVVAGLADRVAVMYAGRIVEIGTAEEVFYSPAHPYTAGLLGAIPQVDTPRSQDLVAIKGRPPSLLDLPSGCAFADRCPLVTAQCRVQTPEAVSPDRHTAACWADPAHVGAEAPTRIRSEAP
jgi:peptide/nickel transport system permease protein